MNAGSLEFGDHGAGDGSADLVVIEDEFGTALVGTDDALDQYMASLGMSLVPVQSESGAVLAQMTDAIFGGRAVRSAYSIANHAQSVLSSPRPSPSAGAKVTYHRMVRDTGSGRILSNARIPDPGVAAMGLGPQAVALIALEAAIAAQFDEIHEHLDVIEDKVDEVLRLAYAEQIGDVYGHHRVLVALVREIRGSHALTATDWLTIASLGVDLAVGVERLRTHAVKQLEILDREAGPAKRAEQLEKMLRTNRLADTLRLLVVAQKSLFLWQKLRLEQVKVREPEYLDQTIVSARDRLHEQFRADIDLITKLREAIDIHAVLRTTEVHHMFVGRTLTKLRVELDELLTEFVRARNLQLSEWGIAEHAKIADALAAARDKAGQIVVGGRRQLARGAAGVAAWVDPKEPDGSRDDEEAHEADEERWIKRQ
ncbi:hypothetical protein [Rhodococcus sp. BL-253-APC-6A1W]|uniref:hypothetical protein n=1 Tax=Rhodococcus sp. BL-253-APC-6A1W TaxID=2725307 RepID=UPI00197F82D9|nr:hypothetical protein [Rhodococcus sp. BL-253-APC-6A1W]